MKFAKLFGICGLLAGMIGLVSCGSDASLDGLWLGIDQETQAPRCILEVKEDQLQLFFGKILNMDTTFQVQGKVNRSAQAGGAKETAQKVDLSKKNFSKTEASGGEKTSIILKSDAVYDVALHEPEDAWAKMDEFYYSDGKLYMR